MARKADLKYMGFARHIAVFACVSALLCPFQADAQAPSITNDIPVPQAGGATLKGGLSAGAPANVYIYWGTNDGGTVKGNWKYVTSMGSRNLGSFSTNITSNIYFGPTYYYRCYATNASGQAWAPSTVSFKALDPIYGGWSYKRWTGDADSGISSDYTYTAKHSFGNNRTNLTINGVTFTEENATNGTGWSIGGAISYWNGDDDASITGYSEDLAEEFVYSGNPRTVRLSGLSQGKAYRAGFYSVAWETGDRRQTFSAPGVATNVINQDAYGNNNGIIISYAYEATNTTQQIIITPVVGSTTLHLYGLSNRRTLSTISSSPATGQTATSAVANATLRASEAIYNVYAYWGDNDGGTISSNWDNTNFVRSVTNMESTNITHIIEPLSINSNYYYIFQAVNDATNVWSSTVSFYTISTPSVNNTAGAIPESGYASLRGQLTYGAAADITIFWGTSDGVTNKSAWQNTNNLGTCYEGSFTNDTTSDLLYGLSYYYRVYATNEAGEAWSAVKRFTTLEPVDEPPAGLNVRCYNNESGDSYTDPIANLFAATHEGVTTNKNQDINYTTFVSANFPGITANDTMSILWYGTFYANADATYSFGTRSDDGSMLYVDANDDGDYTDSGEKVVSNNGAHGAQERTGNITLSAGYYPIAIGYYQAGGGLAMAAKWKQGSGVTYASQNYINPSSGNFLLREPVNLAIVLTNTCVTNITATTATFNGSLGAPKCVFDVFLMWGPTDGETTKVDWAYSDYIGSYTNVALTNISYTLESLTQGGDYYCTLMATNAAGKRFAQPSIAFSTMDTPLVNNDGGAIPGVNYALLRGSHTNSWLADISIYWGETDGGTTAANWANTNRLGTLYEGFFTNSTLTNLLYGLTYYYRCYGANYVTVDWADSTTNFTTLDPGISIENDNVQNLTINSATFAATLNATSAVLDAYVYWGTNNGGTNAGSWNYSSYIGSYTNDPAVELTFPTNGLTGGAEYFYTFRATNQLKSIWATPSWSFRTTHQPAINNMDGAIPGIKYANLRGELTDGSRADITVYWGTSDGGTSHTSWAYSIHLPEYDEGYFAPSTPTNLAYGEQYYYRCFASNDAGTAWADSTEDFFTEGDTEAYSISNNPATGLTSPSVTFNGTLHCPQATFDVYVYWGTSDGENVETNWARTNFVGTYTDMSPASITFTTNNLTPSTLYYYTFRAVSDAINLWASPSESFISYHLSDNREQDFDDWIATPDSKLITGVPVNTNAEDWTAEKVYITDLFSTLFPAADSTPYACWFDDMAGASKPILTSPLITDGIGIIEFSHASAKTGSAQVFSVAISSDGSTWITNGLYTNSAVSTAWITNTCTVNNFNSFYVQFRKISDGGVNSQYLGLDNISIKMPDPFITFTNLTLSPVPQTTESATTVSFQTAIRNDMGPVTASNITAKLYYSTNSGVSYITNVMTKTGTTNFSFTIPVHKKLGDTVLYYASANYELQGQTPATAYYPTSAPREYFEYYITVLYSYDRSVNFDNWTTSPLANILNNIPTTATNSGWFADDVYIAAGSLYQMPPANSSPNMIVFDDTVAGSQPYLISTNYPLGIGTIYFSQNARMVSSIPIGFVIETSTNRTTWTKQASFIEEDDDPNTWHTNQLTINIYDNCWLRFSVTNAPQNGRYLCLDNILVSHPPADARIENIYFAPAYPATNDSVYVYCEMISPHSGSPIVEYLPKVVSRSKNVGIWQTNEMQRLSGELFTGLIYPSHPYGEAQYYILGDFTGYYYVHSNGFSECLAPRLNPVDSPDSYFTYKTRYRKSDYDEAYIDSNVGSFEMQLSEDHVWQGIIQNLTSNSLSFTISGIDYRPYCSSNEPIDYTFGDTNQWRLTTPMEHPFTITPTEIILNNAETNTQYMVIFNFNNNQYIVQRCQWQNFNNWSIHPELFADGANTFSARSWCTNFNGWNSNSIVKAQDFQSNTNIDWNLYTNYNPSSPYYYTIDDGWRIKYARIIKNSGTDDYSASGNSLQFDDTPNYNPMLYITKTNRTDGVEKMTFDYRASDTNLYTTVYTNDTTGWPTNDFYIIFDGGSIAWSEYYERDTAFISCYYMYQNQSNYFEARLTPSYDTGDGRIEYLGSLRKIVDGSVVQSAEYKEYEPPLKRWQIRIDDQGTHSFKYNNNGFWDLTNATPFTDPGTIGFGAADMDFVISNNLHVFRGSVDGYGNITNITALYYAVSNNTTWTGWENLSTSDVPWLISSTNGIARIGHTGMVELIYGTADLNTDSDVEDHNLWDIVNYMTVTNLYWQSFTYNVQTSENVYLPIMYGAGYGNLHLDNVKTYGWRGQSNYTASGWLATESWVTTNDFDNDGRSIDLQMSRRRPPEEQYLRSPLLTTIGNIDFRCYTPNNKTATFELQIAETVPTGWKTLITQSVKTNSWTTFGWPINTNINGYLRILHTTTNNEGWLRIDDINIFDHQTKATNTWIGYNFMSTDRTNGLTDIFQLFSEDGRTAHLNHKSDEDILGSQPLDDYIPHIRTPYLKNGIGTISFWFRNWSMSGGINAGNLKIQTASHQDGPWNTLKQIDTTSDVFQYFSTNLYDLDSRYVRIANDNANLEPDRFSIDNLLITDPFGTDIAIQNLEVIPSVPLDGDEVKFRAEFTDYLFGVTNVTAILYYRTTDAAWAMWGTNGIPLPMACIYTNYATNPPVYTYETIGKIPSATNVTDRIVQYFVRGTFNGDRFAEKTSPKDHKDFTNPSWYYPVNLNTNDPPNTIPYYVVFSCPPGAVWINELNLLHYFSEFTNEYIELCGIAGADIANWRVDLMNSSQILFTNYFVTNNTVLNNEKDGYGFWVLGDDERPGNDQNLTVVWPEYSMEQHIPFVGGLRLVRSMGAYEHRVCYNLASPWTDYDEMINDAGWGEFIAYAGSLQLYGSGSNRYDFTWGFITNSLTYNYINSGQSFGEYVEVIITDLWMTSTTLWIQFTAPTNITPTVWSATNLTNAAPWTKITNSFYTNSMNVYTQWFTLPTNTPVFYKVSVTN